MNSWVRFERKKEKRLLFLIDRLANEPFTLDVLRSRSWEEKVLSRWRSAVGDLEDETVFRSLCILADVCLLLSVAFVT